MCPWYPSEIIKTIVWLNKRHFHLRGVWIQSTQNMINVCLHFVALHGKDEMSVHTEMQINILLLPIWNVALKVSSDSTFIRRCSCLIPVCECSPISCVLLHWPSSPQFVHANLPPLTLHSITMPWMPAVACINLPPWPSPSLPPSPWHLSPLVCSYLFFLFKDGPLPLRLLLPLHDVLV